MKYLLVIAFFLLSGSAFVPGQELKCNIKTCGIDLLNFKHFAIADLIRKFQVGIFCVRHCTPPIVHELFQSINYAINKKVPQLCYGRDCSEDNRFVSLSHCVEKNTWPLMQCGFKLLQLIQFAVEPLGKNLLVNTTCNTIMDTTECIEEHLQKCGHRPFSLVKEIFSDVVEFVASGYCHGYHPRLKITPSFDENSLTEIKIPEYHVAEALEKGPSNDGKSIYSPYQFITTLSAATFLYILF